jgi:hypothetical protein
MLVEWVVVVLVVDEATLAVVVVALKVTVDQVEATEDVVVPVGIEWVVAQAVEEVLVTEVVLELIDHADQPANVEAVSVASAGWVAFHLWCGFIGLSGRPGLSGLYVHVSLSISFQSGWGVATAVATGVSVGPGQTRWMLVAVIVTMSVSLGWR